MNSEQIANPYLDANRGDYAHFGKLLVDERLSRTTLSRQNVDFESLF